MAKPLHIDDEVKDDAFKDVFKQYKRKQPPPDFSHVIDFQKHDVESTSANEVKKLPPITKGFASTKSEELGLKPMDSWKIYQLEKHPGN